MPALSIVVPVLDEAAGIEAALQALTPLRARGAEVIVVDGGSRDGSARLAAPWADRVLGSARGRARQMNAGAAVARSELLLFLHADTRLPDAADALLQQAVAQGALWGRFDVQIDGRSPLLRIVAALMNQRSRWTGIATGDQALFVRRDRFQRIGGFADQPLMEDIEISRRLRTVAWPHCLRQRVRTSGRRWDTRGVWRTIFLMWRLRWLYWRGVPPQVLAEAYR
jgi:rSAM/selenodomain-associated transferase 2